jgi:hypothetical protein
MFGSVFWVVCRFNVRIRNMNLRLARFEVRNYKVRSIYSWNGLNESLLLMQKLLHYTYTIVMDSGTQNCKFRVFWFWKTRYLYLELNAIWTKQNISITFRDFCTMKVCKFFKNHLKIEKKKIVFEFFNQFLWLCFGYPQSITT